MLSGSTFVDFFSVLAADNSASAVRKAGTGTERGAGELEDEEEEDEVEDTDTDEEEFCTRGGEEVVEETGEVVAIIVETGVVDAAEIGNEIGVGVGILGELLTLVLLLFGCVCTEIFDCGLLAFVESINVFGCWVVEVVGVVGDGEEGDFGWEDNFIVMGVVGEEGGGEDNFIVIGVNGLGDVEVGIVFELLLLLVLILLVLLLLLLLIMLLLLFVEGII